MKKKLVLVSLLVVSSAVQSDELDNLIDASAQIAGQIDYGIQVAGAGMQYGPTGTGLSNGSLSENAHISTAQLDAYNNALAGMTTYQPYGDVGAALNNAAEHELDLMDQAVDTFTNVVADMLVVQEIAEISEQAATPEQKAEVAGYVTANTEELTISQEDVDIYNQSIDDIETHANRASAYLAVAASSEAVNFLQTSAQTNNSDANEATLTYDANKQWVKMSWAGTTNASAVYLNGVNSSLGIANLYLSEEEVLLAGSQSELYLSGPTNLGYKCFMTQTDCEEVLR